VRARASKGFAAVLVTVAIGVQLLELSGRWDSTLQDANDEAGLVAIVLCVGTALVAGATVLARLRRVSVRGRLLPVPRITHDRIVTRLLLPHNDASPPLALRI
jgi:hypothetical protein